MSYRAKSKRCMATVVTSCMMSVHAVAGALVLNAQSKPSPTASATLTSLTLVPVRTFGSVTTTSKARALSGAVRLGRYVVVLRKKPTSLTFFSVGGDSVRVIVPSDRQRNGQPKSITWIGRCARDELYVLDASAKRMLVLDAEGRYLRAFRIPSFAAQWTCTEGGLATMLVPGVGSPPSSAATRLHSLILLLDGNGDERGTIEGVAAGEPRFAGVATTIAMSRGKVFVGTADTTIITVYDTLGRRNGVLQLGKMPRRPMSADAFERIIRRQFGSTWPDSIVRKVQATPRPAFHPLFRDLRASPNGTLWLTLSAASDDTTRWRAFSVGGRVVGDAVLPYSARILEAGDDYLLIGRQMPAGEELVRWYRLDRR